MTKLFVVYLKFKFSWVSYILPDREPREVHIRAEVWAKLNKLEGKEGRVWRVPNSKSREPSLTKDEVWLQEVAWLEVRPGREAEVQCQRT